MESIVLLGDPGAGKSHLFQGGCQSENGLFFTVDTFLTYADDRCKDRIIYIDGLDERRSSLANSSVFIEIIKKLIEIKPLKIRVSCRVADWLGSTDLELFKPFFDGLGSYSVISLEKLQVSEIKLILKQVLDQDVTDFISSAKRKGVESLLDNPQTLLMLVTTVNAGKWPDSKYDLFEKSTEILVTEFNDKHLILRQNTHRNDELLLLAGKMFSHLLIGNAAGITTKKNHEKDWLPYIESMVSDNELAASKILINTRLFTSLGIELYSYSHRTIAEFLAAKWLSYRVGMGLSLNRIMSSWGYHGYPSAELRGLFAWFTCVSNNVANQVMFKDPYAVISYGDPSVLSKSNKVCLLNEIEGLSKREPWFYGYSENNEIIGSMSCSELAPKFTEILSSKESSYHLRTLVLNCIEYGPDLPQLKKVLVDILENPNKQFGERYDAYKAIVSSLPNGSDIVRQSYKEKLIDDESAVILKTKIIHEMYTSGYMPVDVIKAFEDYLNLSESGSVGDLWNIGQSFPVNEIPDILDGLAKLAPSKDTEYERYSEREIDRNFSLMLERLLKEYTPETSRLYTWLYSLVLFKGYYYNGGSDSDDKYLKKWLTKNTQVLLELFIYSLTINKEQRVFMFWDEFNKLTLYSIMEKEFIFSLFNNLKSGVYVDDTTEHVFELCLMLSLRHGCDTADLYFDLIDFSIGTAKFEAIVSNWNSSPVDDWRYKDAIRKSERHLKTLERTKNNRLDFAKSLGKISSGTHIGWLTFISNVYFDQYRDSFKAESPYKRLEKELGESNTVIALDALNTYLHSDQLPTLENIIQVAIEGKRFRSWYISLAAMDEHCQRGFDSKDFTNEQVKTLLALTAILTTFKKEGNTSTPHERDWIQTLTDQNISIAIDVYFSFLHKELQAKSNHFHTDRQLIQISENRPKVNEKLLQLVNDFPTMNSFLLKELLVHLHKSGLYIESLKTFGDALLSKQNKIKGESRNVWICFLFLIEPNNYFLLLKKAIKRNKDIIWCLINFGNEISTSQSERFLIDVKFLHPLIELLGLKFPYVNHPKSGWSGSHNPWDASEYILKLINVLSTSSEKSTTTTLTSLLSNNKLSSYHVFLKNALSNQVTLYRQSQYQQPSWQQTLLLLQGGAPTSPHDLLILTIDFLEDIQQEILCANTDAYKAFWNEDSYGRVISPKVEESCRDRLLELLRVKIQPLNVIAEPEGHMAQDKRADIVMYLGTSIKLPIEIKREGHADIWSAHSEQLEALYCIDPAASGYGLYLVIWYGYSKIKKSPNLAAGPRTAEELQFMLEKLSLNEKISVFVLDVSGPKKTNKQHL